MNNSNEDIETIRLRPGMYIGDVHDGGLFQMIWELVANALDEHYHGSCRTVSVEIGEDGSVAVEDDGCGIPMSEVKGLPFAQLALTSIHDTPTLDGHAPHEHLGPHGAGLVAVNALSSWLLLEIFRDGRHFRQRYERGIPCTVAQDVEPTNRTGTRITFLPDPAIFSDPWINAGTVATRLRELACLVPSLTFSFADHRRQRFQEPRGLRSLLERTRYPRESILSVLTVNEVLDGISVEAAMEWRQDRWSSIESYANIQRTTDGGTHVRGLLNGLARGLRSADAQRCGKRTLRELRETVSRGLHAIVCVRLRDPTFGAPTRSKLMTPSVEMAVSS